MKHLTKISFLLQVLTILAFAFYIHHNERQFKELKSQDTIRISINRINDMSQFFYEKGQIDYYHTKLTREQIDTITQIFIKTK